MLDRVPHKPRAKGEVLRPLMGEPAGDECQVPRKRVRNGPDELGVPFGRGKSDGSDDTVRLGKKFAVPCSAQPVLRGVIEYRRVEQVCVIARPVGLCCWPAVSTALAEKGVE